MVGPDGWHVAIERDITNTGQDRGVIRKGWREIDVSHDFT